MHKPEAAIADAIKTQSVSSIDNLETTTVKLPSDVLDFLRQRAETYGVSTGDALRMALGTQKFLAEAVEAGGKVTINGRNGITDVKI